MEPTPVIVDLTTKHIIQYVVQECGKIRAKNFISGLLRELQIEVYTGDESNILDLALSKVTKHNTAKELLFESYRRVCLSASRELGPNIIGLLTGKILNENRIANEIEERIFMLAEEMNDREMIDFCSFYDKNIRGEKPSAEFRLLLNEEHRDTNYKSIETAISPPPLISSLGIWASKLERRGFLHCITCISEIDYSEDSERYVDESGILKKYFHYAVFKEDIMQFYKILRRAQGPKA